MTIHVWRAVTRSASGWLSALVLCPLALFSLQVIMVLWPSGRSQELTPALIEKRLVVGMTADQVARKVNVDTRRHGRWSQPDGTGGYSVAVTGIGWGSAVAVQHRIRLGFDRNALLVGGSVEYVYRCDESNAGLALGHFEDGR